MLTSGSPLQELQQLFRLRPGSPELLLNGELLCFHAREPVLKFAPRGVVIWLASFVLVSLPLSNEKRAPGGFFFHRS